MVFTITLFSTFTTIQTCWRILNIVLFYYVLFRPPSFWKRFCPVLNSPRNSDIIDIYFFLLIHYLKVILIRQVLNSHIYNKSEQKGEIKIFPNFLSIYSRFVCLKSCLNLCQLVTLVPDHLLTLSSRQTVGTNTRTIRAHESAISTIYSVCAVPWKKRDNFGFNANSTNY